MKIGSLSAAIKQWTTMRLLERPALAKKMAGLAERLIRQGGMPRQLAQHTMKPLTQVFSMGSTVEEAVKRALNEKSQVLLDYVEEMVEMPQDRERVAGEIDHLLDVVRELPLFAIPLKLTALIDHKILEKLSCGQALSTQENALFEREVARVDNLLAKADEACKIVKIDQEYPHQKRAIFDIMRDLSLKYNRGVRTVYSTIQASDRDCFRLVKELCKVYPAVKLVNGAYVDWAHRNGYGESMQPSKMASFVAFVLIAKFCMERKIPLYVGTHNPILERILDSYEGMYVKGQLYGFNTKQNVQTLYAIFGPKEQCIDYALRRVTEGSASRDALTAPIMTFDEAVGMAENSGLGVMIDLEEYREIVQAVRFDTQKVRGHLAQTHLLNLVARR